MYFQSPKSFCLFVSLCSFAVAEVALQCTTGFPPPGSLQPPSDVAHEQTTHGLQVIAPGLNFSCHGRIKEWSALVAIQGESLTTLDHQLTLQVWRPSSSFNGQFDLVGSNTLQVTPLRGSTSENITISLSRYQVNITVDERISFQPGDVLGWYLPPQQSTQNVSVAMLSSNSSSNLLSVPSSEEPCQVYSCDDRVQYHSSAIPLIRLNYETINVSSVSAFPNRTCVSEKSPNSCTSTTTQLNTTMAHTPEPSTSTLLTPSTSTLPTPFTSKLPTSSISTLPTSSISTLPTSSISTLPTPSTSTLPTPFTSKLPTSSISTLPTSSISTLPTSSISTLPTPSTSTLPTPSTSTLLTPSTSTLPTSFTSALPTPSMATSTLPTPSISTLPPPSTSTQSLSSVSTNSTPSTFTLLTSSTSAPPTLSTSTLPILPISTQPTPSTPTPPSTSTPSTHSTSTLPTPYTSTPLTPSTSTLPTPYTSTPSTPSTSTLPTPSSSTPPTPSTSTRPTPSSSTPKNTGTITNTDIIIACVVPAGIILIVTLTVLVIRCLSSTWKLLQGKRLKRTFAGADDNFGMEMEPACNYVELQDDVTTPLSPNDT